MALGLGLGLRLGLGLEVREHEDHVERVHRDGGEREHLVRVSWV